MAGAPRAPAHQTLNPRTPQNTMRYFITTAIPYVNARPHIGFALELVQTDAFARYQRGIGMDVRFLTGTDENALKNVQAAEAAGISPRGRVDQNSQGYRRLRGRRDP